MIKLQFKLPQTLISRGFTRKTVLHLIFDRYIENSIKSGTRLKRIRNFNRTHKLSLETPLPPKEVSLSSNKTKENFIELIAAELIKCANKHSFDNKLVVTSKSPFPKQLHRGITIIRYDMETTFDEADYIIPHQVVILKLHEMLLHFIQNLDAEESGLLEDLVERRACDSEWAQLSEQFLEIGGQVKVLAEKYVELFNIQERVEE